MDSGVFRANLLPLISVLSVFFAVNLPPCSMASKCLGSQNIPYRSAISSRVSSAFLRGLCGLCVMPSPFSTFANSTNGDGAPACY